ncbi:S1 family peptidase [Nakamurella lactea]|uniref:S1 family peptidase n=1 Tax=Nakamurella lactea TaxID=459515 RepID=UPI0004916CC6|nr:S1 family peptidase [Nakamurella lactea]
MAALVAALFVGSMAVTVTATAETDEDPVVLHIAAADHVSLQEATIRADVESKASLIGVLAKEAFLDSYAGLYYDPEGPRVRIKGSIGEDQLKELDTKLSTIGVPAERVKVVSARFTESEMVALADQIGNLIHTDLPYTQYVVKPDIRTESISVSVPREQVKAVDLIIVGVQEQSIIPIEVSGADSMPVTQTCNTTNQCTDYLRGGISLEFVSRQNHYYCTSGVMVRGRGTGNTYMMTAGHCGFDIGDPFYAVYPNSSLHSIGPKHSSTYRSGGDAGLVKVTNPNWTIKPWIYSNYSGVNGQYLVQGTSLNTVGVRVCKSGRTTGTTCGEITDVTLTVSYCEANSSYGNCALPVVPVNHLVESDMCAQGGDSGAPIFSYHLVYGILSGIILNSCTVFYTGITTDANALNVDVILG